MIVIGSWAYEFSKNPDLTFYEWTGNDIDVIANEEEQKSLRLMYPKVRFDFQDPDFMNNKEIEEIFPYTISNLLNSDIKILGVEGLFALKKSHVWHPNRKPDSFRKNIHAYHTLKKEFEEIQKIDAALLHPIYLEKVNKFVKDRTKMTEEFFNVKTPVLNVPAEKFFDDFVVKKYDHDMLHDMAAHLDVPIYKMIQPDNSDTVWCSEELFSDLSSDLQLWCVQEEAYVIACERFLIPNDWEGSFGAAYMKALDKICTTLTSGWFRQFAIDNYYELIKMFDKTKISSIKEGLEHFDGLHDPCLLGD